MKAAPPSSGDELTRVLPGIAEEEYGPSYREHVLQLYKTYLEMADRISGRREKANAFFLTVNTALIALLAKDTDLLTPGPVEFLIPVAGGFLCYLWYRIIRSYRDLNSAKFRVIHAMEAQLPLRPYDAEWESVGRGKDPKRYLPFTHVEGIVPWLFMAIHVALVLCRVPWIAVCTKVRVIG